MKFCPHCGGDLSRYLAATGGAAVPSPGPYDQTKTWRTLLAKATERDKLPTFMELIDPAVNALPANSTGELDTIVHLLFNHKIVPDGGVLYRAAMLDGKVNIQPKELETRGYLVLDGKVVLVDDVPVGPAYGALDYWGGEKQFKRWHLTKPCTINPSRNGNPFFMDEEMIAFGASWRDSLKIKEALLNLFTLFGQGVNGDKPIAHPLALQITVNSQA